MISDVQQSKQALTAMGAEVDLVVLKPNMSKGHALFLHGGSSDLDKYVPLAQELSAHGYTCILFSFPGHGSSSGTVEGWSMQDRLGLTKEVLSKLKVNKLDILCGFSMGGYLGAMLSKDIDIEKLVLIVPAVYAKRAHTAPLGKEFKSILHEPESEWDSYIWGVIATYSGELVVLSGAQDEVIPNGLHEYLVKQAVSANKVIHHTVVNGGHRLVDSMLVDKDSQAATAQFMADPNELNLQALAELLEVRI